MMQRTEAAVAGFKASENILRLQEHARTLSTKVLDLFVERLRQYIVYAL
jgi:hypothetical protein